MNKSVKLFFCGDFCSKPSTNPIAVSNDLKQLIATCDFKVCNFEVPLKPDNVDPRAGCFFQNDDAPGFLEDLGFNLFSFANNHAFDYGLEGWKKTMASFRHTPFGSGKYEDAYKVKVVEKDGIKVGFLPLCYAARWGVFDNYTDKNSYACAWVNDLKVNHVIIDAKKEVDFLFVLPHDGIEYINLPLPETIARYRDFIDYGADAVIGSHPHCPQGWEEYKGKPIFYSLGNFLFNSKEGYSYRATDRPHWYDGRCVVMDIDIESKKLRYDVINTQNEGNLAITIDKSSEASQYNQLICSYLTDDELYHKTLVETLTPIASGECNLVSNAFYYSTAKQLLKNIIKLITTQLNKQKREEANTKLERLMKDDTRRASVLSMIQEKTNVFSYDC